MPHTVHGEEGEVEDIPFARNDMDKPLDATDAPGRADSEMADDSEPTGRRAPGSPAEFS